jgi:hypothetical protein
MDPTDVKKLFLGPDAAYASLAAKMSAELTEVRTLAGENELRKFFIRTDGPPAKPRQLAAAAVTSLLARKEDPWS